MQTRPTILNTDPAFSMESTLLQAQTKERCKPPSATPSVLRRVIGFNPIPRKENEKPASGPLNAFPAAGKTVLQEMQGKSPRSPISPRSALQTLLAAARQDGGKEKNSPSLSSNSKSSAVHTIAEIGSINEKTQWEQAFGEPFAQNASISSIRTTQSPAISPVKAAGCTSSLKKDSAWTSVSRQTSSHVHKDLERMRIQEAHDCQPVVFDPVASERKRSGTQQFLFVATSPVTDNILSAPTVDFLEACYLCKRRLGQGLDIFMYRGDKAFCSVECRYQQIAMDERKEKQSPSLLRSGSANPARQERRRRSVLAGTAAAG